MNGVLEHMQQAIATLQQRVATLEQAASAQQGQMAPNPAMGFQQPQGGFAGGQAQGGFAGAGLGGGQPQAQQNVTSEMILSLITPLLENPHAKSMLQQQLTEMGIPGLPDAQPHQYGELYQRFSNVAQQFAAAQAQQGQQTNAAPSII